MRHDTTAFLSAPQGKSAAYTSYPPETVWSSEFMVWSLRETRGNVKLIAKPRPESRNKTPLTQ
jgi:hypothetical protein